LSKHAATRAFWSLLAGSLVIGVLGLFQETPQGLAAMSLLDIALLVYLGIFSTSVTFWILQGATAVLTPAAVTAYGYLVPVVSVLLLFMEQPDRLGWSWAPGSAMVLLAIVSLLRRDAV
jgi:drug/metabolite transporter (DMT)-like permease